MRLRTLLSIIFAVLLVVTDGFVGWVGYSTSRHALKKITEHEFALVNESTAHEIGNFLDGPASRLLDELSLRARRKLLNLDDDHVLGINLAERLRVNPSLAWISYSTQATGRFVGVWRRQDGAIILNRSLPDQPAREQIITADGKELEYHRGVSKLYDPRGHPWYLSAMGSTVTMWSRPYEFEEGDWGVTASRSWRADDTSAPAGVFTVDFHLGDLEHKLDGMQLHTRGFSCVLDDQGGLFCAAKHPDSGPLAAALGDWVKAHPNFKNIGVETTSHLIPIQANGETHLAALYRVNTPTGFKCIVASMVPESVLYEEVNRGAGRMIAICLIGLAVALCAGWFIANRVSEPLRMLGHDLAQVGQFRLERGKKSTPSIVEEVNQLRDAADLMKSGLRSFMRYVPDDLVRQLLKSGQEAALGGKVQRLTLFFSDIEGFTAHSEKVAPDVLVQELSQYFDILSQTLRKHSGTIDKFIGDGLLGFFNAPSDVPNHETKACLATLEALEALRHHQGEKPLTAFYTRVGLHCGDVLVGNIGTPERFAYTVLGDVVNVASRLESLNKVYGTQIIASHEVQEKTGDAFEWRHLDRISVAGRRGQTNIFELLGVRGNLSPEQLAYRDLYEKALNVYFARSFAEAERLFEQLSQLRPEDKAAQLMQLRSGHMRTVDLPDDWDGVFAYTVK